ncbi:MAG: aminotransferase class III-fold pyridoxal phosphate-dependent enzyme [bacterium]|nr:aminotransferase class III-fold pyridoxal phosphate-dependent enzyme [bacterium]
MEKRSYAEEHRYWIIPTTVPPSENEALLSGSGVWMRVAGKKYFDACAQVSCANLGHNHPRFTELMELFWKNARTGDVITSVMGTDFLYENHSVLELSPVALAKRLAPHCFGAENTIFGFHVTGTQAVNVAIRFFRTVTKKPFVISFEKAFHGRDGEARDVSDSNPVHWDEVPRSGNVFFLPYPETKDDFERTLQCLNDIPLKKCAAVIYEPIQGEGGGMRVGNWLAEIEYILQGEGIFSISDEIQAGLGRCGSWWGYQQIRCNPDAIVIGKSLGSGHPISAVAFKRSRCDVSAFPAGKVSGTFTMSPVGIAAANFTMHIYEKEKIVQRAEKNADIFSVLLSTIITKANSGGAPYPWRADGAGLYRSIKPVNANWHPDWKKRDSLVQALRDVGVWTLGASRAYPAVRITPPLIASEEELKFLAEKIGEAIAITKT